MLQIKTLCQESLAGDSTDPDGGRVIECLKEQLTKQKITIQQNTGCIKVGVRPVIVAQSISINETNILRLIYQCHRGLQCVIETTFISIYSK